MTLERGRLNELRSAVSNLQGKLRNQEELLNDFSERLVMRDTGAHERLRVVEASMAALRGRLEVLETEEAKHFAKPKTPRPQDASKQKHPRELQNGENRVAEVEESLKRLRSDLHHTFSLAEANSSRLEALEAKDPTDSKQLFSCVESAAQVATRAFASLDSSVKSMELQISSITASVSACGEEQQRQAAELEQLGHQVAHLKSSSQEQLEDLHESQLKMLDAIEVAKAEQEEVLRSSGFDGKVEVAHLEKSMASLRAELGERHSMLEERLLRTQSRVAQEIGEQRAHTERRLQHLEDEASRAFMSNDHDARERVRLKEADDALWKSVEHVENRLNGVSKCLQTLYRKVGLPAREALAVQDMALVSTESDVWVGPGFCQLQSPRVTPGYNFR